MSFSFNEIATPLSYEIFCLSQNPRCSVLRFSKSREESSFYPEDDEKVFHPTHSGILIVNEKIDRFSLVIFKKEAPIYETQDDRTRLRQRVVKRAIRYEGEVQSTPHGRQLKNLAEDAYVVKRIHELDGEENVVEIQDRVIKVHRKFFQAFPRDVAKVPVRMPTRIRKGHRVIEILNREYFSDLSKIRSELNLNNVDLIKLACQAAQILKKFADWGHAHGDVKWSNFLVDLRPKNLRVLANDFELAGRHFSVHVPVDPPYLFFDELRNRDGFISSDFGGLAMSIGGWIIGKSLGTVFGNNKGLSWAEFREIALAKFYNSEWISDAEWLREAREEIFDLLEARRDRLPPAALRLLDYTNCMKALFTSTLEMEDILLEIKETLQLEPFCLEDLHLDNRENTCMQPYRERLQAAQPKLDDLIACLHKWATYPPTE